MDVTDKTPVVEPLDGDVDHVRGEAGTPVILEYGDYECPYSRQAFRSISAWSGSSRAASASPSATSR
jgi:hypothetical protein